MNHRVMAASSEPPRVARGLGCCRKSAELRASKEPSGSCSQQPPLATEVHARECWERRNKGAVEHASAQGSQESELRL
jgi:hypothetical protein